MLTGREGWGQTEGVDEEVILHLINVSVPWVSPALWSRPGPFHLQEVDLFTLLFFLPVSTTQLLQYVMCPAVKFSDILLGEWSGGADRSAASYSWRCRFNLVYAVKRS